MEGEMKQIFPIVPANSGPLWLIAGFVAVVLIGVTLLFAHTPWRSGLPSGVRGTLYEGSTPYFARGSSAGDCATIEAVAARVNATRTAPTVLMDPPGGQESVAESQ